MVHPATRRVVKAAIDALGVPLDIGFVFPPKPGEARGFGQWTNRDLTPGEVMALLPRAAAANSQGGAVYMRLGPSAKANHPGIVLLDDLTIQAVEQLSQDGFEPCLVVETSPGNFQAWVRLAGSGCSVPYSAMGAAARYMAGRYGGDPRAVSPRQPGRLPGFTNRKAKHQLATGAFPYVRLTHAEPAREASAGPRLISQLIATTNTGRAAGAAPETPRSAAGLLTGPVEEILAQLDAIHQDQAARIRGEVAEGYRPAHAATRSEVDFAVVRAARVAGVEDEHIELWVRRVRPEKDLHYATRTLQAVEHWTNATASKLFR